MKSAVGINDLRARSEQFIMDEDGTLMRDEVRMFERWRCFPDMF